MPSSAGGGCSRWSDSTECRLIDPVSNGIWLVPPCLKMLLPSFRTLLHFALAARVLAQLLLPADFALATLSVHGALLSSLLSLLVALTWGIAILGIWALASAFFFHLDPQSALVALFLPLWQLIGVAVGLVATGWLAGRSRG